MLVYQRVPNFFGANSLHFQPKKSIDTGESHAVHPWTSNFFLVQKPSFDRADPAHDITHGKSSGDLVKIAGKLMFIPPQKIRFLVDIYRFLIN